MAQVQTSAHMQGRLAPKKLMKIQKSHSTNTSISEYSVTLGTKVVLLLSTGVVISDTESEGLCYYTGSFR